MCYMEEILVTIYKTNFCLKIQHGPFDRVILILFVFIYELNNEYIYKKAEVLKNLELSFCHCVTLGIQQLYKRIYWIKQKSCIYMQ